jgi:hypothetical protein
MTTNSIVHSYTHTHPELINKQNREWIALTSSLPSAPPSRFSVFRPWLKRRCPNYRSVLRRLVLLRLSCSSFSSKKSPHWSVANLFEANTRSAGIVYSEIWYGQSK